MKTIITCHITTVHERYDTRIFLKECKSLVSAGFEVHLIVADGKGNTNKDGIFIHDIGRAKSRLIRMIKQPRKALKKVLEIKPNLVHFHDPELLPIGIKLAKKGIYVIYDVHEDVPRQTLGKYYIPGYFRHIVAKMIELYENYAVKKFDAIVCATPFIRDRFLRLGVNAVDVQNMPILSEFIDIQVDWAKKEKAVCYVGGLDEIRGLYKMIEAIGKVDAKLILAGNFTRDEQKSIAMAMDGWSNVEYEGFADRKKVREIFSRSRAGIVLLLPKPNYVNSQPTKLFEYMCAGLPVIASNFPLWKEIVESNECGITVNPLKTEDIAKAIEYLIEHPDEARQMGERGRKAVLDEYNWEKESLKLLKIYENFRRSKG